MKWQRWRLGMEMPIRRKTSISSSDYRSNINPVEGGDIRSFRRGALRASPHLRVALACTLHRRTTLARSIPGIILYRYIHSLTLLFRCLTWQCMILSFSSFALLRRRRCRRSGCGFSGLEDEESASGVNSRRDALSIMVNYLIRSDHRLEGVSAGGTVEPEIVVLMSSSRMTKLLSCQHRF